MILKAILCVQNFSSFDTMLFIVNLLIKADSTVFVFLICLRKLFVMSHLKKKQICKISSLKEVPLLAIFTRNIYSRLFPLSSC